MDFQAIIAGTRYDVLTAAGVIQNAVGESTFADISHDRRQIVLSGLIPEADRAAVACAAVSQAWADVAAAEQREPIVVDFTDTDDPGEQPGEPKRKLRPFYLEASTIADDDPRLVAATAAWKLMFGHVKSQPPFDPDNDVSRIRPRAWKRAKDCFGEGSHVHDQMLRFEKAMAPASPQYWLAIALHHWMELPKEERTAALIEWTRHPEPEERPVRRVNLLGAEPTGIAAKLLQSLDAALVLSIVGAGHSIEDIEGAVEYAHELGQILAPRPSATPESDRLRESVDGAAEEPTSERLPPHDRIVTSDVGEVFALPRK